MILIKQEDNGNIMVKTSIKNAVKVFYAIFKLKGYVRMTKRVKNQVSICGVSSEKVFVKLLKEGWQICQ